MEPICLLGRQNLSGVASASIRDLIFGPYSSFVTPMDSAAIMEMEKYAKGRINLFINSSINKVGAPMYFKATKLRKLL